MNIQNQSKLRSKARVLKPIVWIGKNGLNSDVFEEINRQLDKKELIKIKLNKSFIDEKDKKKIARDIAVKTKSDLISVVGFIILLYRQKNIDRKQ